MYFTGRIATNRYVAKKQTSQGYTSIYLRIFYREIGTRETVCAQRSMSTVNNADGQLIEIKQMRDVCVRQRAPQKKCVCVRQKRARESVCQKDRKRER